METTELLIQLNGNRMDSSLIVDGVVTQRAALPKKGGVALLAWLEERTTDRVHARLHVSGASEMRLALELASMLARAGHIINVGGGLPVQPRKTRCTRGINLMREILAMLRPCVPSPSN